MQMPMPASFARTSLLPIALSVVLVTVLAPASASARLLYSTSFEEFPAGELLTTTEVPSANHTLVERNSWFYNFGNEATVTSTRARSGSNSIVVDKANSNLRLAGPWSASVLDFQYSFFIDGPSEFGPGIFNFAGDPIGPLRVILPDGLHRYSFIGGASIASVDQDGDMVMESLRISTHFDSENPALTAPVPVGQWNTVNSRFNTLDQTMRLRFNGQSLGMLPMANILFGAGDVTEFPFFEMFTLNTPDHRVYVDDFSISAVPVPAPMTSLLVACGVVGIFGYRRRFRRVTAAAEQLTVGRPPFWAVESLRE